MSVGLLLAALAGGAIAIWIILAIIGGGVSAFSAKAIIDKIQSDHLWQDQSGVVRETTLIPTPVGLDRSQMIRFDQPLVTQQGAFPIARLCVAEGFLCGFDPLLPSPLFSAKDACPNDFTLPTAVTQLSAGIMKDLGCLQYEGDDPQTGAEKAQGWLVWKFDFGILMMRVGDPHGSERIAALWIHDGAQGSRVLSLQWMLPGQGSHWYNVHVYNTATAVTTSSGDAPHGEKTVPAGSGGAPFIVKPGDPDGPSLIVTSGDSNHPSTSDNGRVDFTIQCGLVQNCQSVMDSTWSLIAEGCHYWHFTFFHGHSCQADILPKMTISVAPPPKQSFSCAAHRPSVPMSSGPGQVPGEGLVLEVGSSCSDSPFGFFAYIWQRACTGGCPGGASYYGFAVVAPSRGWTSGEFYAIISKSMAAYRAASGHDYLPITSPGTVGNSPGTVDIPISPPVRGTPSGDGTTTTWSATGPPSSHTVTFRWAGPAGAGNILADTGAPSVFGPLTVDPAGWPTALGHISAPDVPAGGELIHSNGAGCFTIAGVPTPSDPDPRGLLVDLRNLSSINVFDQLRSSALLSACP